MNDYFISFGTTKGNLGCVVVSSTSSKAALIKATKLGLNLGGEAATWRMPSDEADKLGRNKVLTPEYLRAHGYHSTKDLPVEQRRGFLDMASIACPDCNDTLRELFKGA